MLPDMTTWPDNMDRSAWYYADVQEATNSHDYEIQTDSEGNAYEVWTSILPVRDWLRLKTSGPRPTLLPTPVK